MSYFLFILKAAFEDFNKNKMRTFLTSLGILIGVAAVVLLLAFGLGLKKYIQDQFESLGTNLIYIMPGKIGAGGGSGLIGGTSFDLKDVLKIRRIKALEVVAPLYSKGNATFTALGQNTTGNLIASSADINVIMNLEAEEGRLFDKADVDKRTKTVVLGPTVANKLFSTAVDGIGKLVKIEDQSFKVIGVVKSKGGGGLGGSDLDSHVYMPYTTAYVFNPDKKFFAIYVKATTKEDIPQVKQDLQELLEKRYKKDAFSVLEQTEILNTVESIFSVINLVLVAIGAISLVVGGIGIMNIMYVSVTERTREIGIRRALGALKKDILFHFLAESVLLSILGGFLALAISYIIIFFIQKVFPAYINLPTVVIALGVSSAIGIFFGVFPAKKAADLSPIEAIRYE